MIALSILQIQRAKQQRDTTVKENIQTIMKSQASRSERLAVADDVIDNSSDMHNLEQQVKKLHRTLFNVSSIINYIYKPLFEMVNIEKI